MSLLGGRGLLLAGALPLVGGLDPALPGQQVFAEGFDLGLALLLYDVVALVGVYREVEVLVGLVAVVVDVLLVVLYARQARVLVVAARHEGAIFGRREHGGPGVGAAVYRVPQKVRYRRQDVELVYRRLDRRALFPPPGLVDDERYPQPLFVDGVVVLLEAVLVESLPVVSEYYKGRLLVEPELFVLVEEVMQKEVLVADRVQVAVELVVLGEPPPAVGVGDDVVVVGRDGEVGRQKRLVVVLLEPPLARLEHDVILVAKVVRLVVALLAHVPDPEEVLVPDVLHELRTPLVVLGRLEKGGPVAVILQQLGQALRGDGVRLRLGPLCVQGRGYPAEGGDERLRSVGDDRVGALE